MSCNFSERVKSVLREAGWYENRRVDITSSIKTLKELGIEVFPQARKILEEFHGLSTDLFNRLFYFDVERVKSFIEDEEVPYFVKIIGQPLCPFAYGERMIILASASEDVIMLHDEWLCYLHFKQLEDALEEAFFPSGGKVKTIWLKPEQQPPGLQDIED